MNNCTGYTSSREFRNIVEDLPMRENHLQRANSDRGNLEI